MNPIVATLGRSEKSVLNAADFAGWEMRRFESSEDVISILLAGNDGSRARVIFDQGKFFGAWTWTECDSGECVNVHSSRPHPRDIPKRPGLRELCKVLKHSSTLD